MQKRNKTCELSCVKIKTLPTSSRRLSRYFTRLEQSLGPGCILRLTHCSDAKRRTFGYQHKLKTAVLSQASAFQVLRDSHLALDADQSTTTNPKT